jgi:hypothetical protein
MVGDWQGRGAPPQQNLGGAYSAWPLVHAFSIKSLISRVEQSIRVEATYKPYFRWFNALHDEVMRVDVVALV